MKLKKSLILCASFILAITMLFSCKAKNDTTDKNNNQSDENTDVIIDENCIWGKGVAPSIILDDHAAEQSTADSWLYTLYYNSEVFPTLLPDTAEEENHEITVGRVNRDISGKAYLYLERKLEDYGDSISDAEGWLIYTNGKSVAIAYDGHFAYIEAIKYFEENCLQNETFAPPKGVVASDIFITEEYVDEIRETRRETELNALVPGIGAEAVDALKKLFSLYIR